LPGFLKIQTGGAFPAENRLDLGALVSEERRMPQRPAQIARRLDAMHERMQCLTGDLNELTEVIQARAHAGAPAPKRMLERFEKIAASYRVTLEGHTKLRAELPKWNPPGVSSVGDF